MNRRVSYYIVFGIFMVSMLALIFGTFVWPKGKAVLYLLTSRKMLDNGKLDAAIEQARAAAQAMPESSIIIRNFWEIYTEAGRNDEAEEELKKLIELAPESGPAYVYLGRLRLARKDIEGAKEAAQKAQSISPDLPEAYFLKGIIAWDEGDFESARVNLKKAVEMKPNDYEFLYRLGALYKMQEDYDLAIEFLKKAIALRPDQIAAHGELAECYFKKGFLVQALAEYKLLINLVNLDRSEHKSDYRAIYMYNIACIYSLRNDVEPALRWLERSIDSGYRDYEYMDKDSDLDNIRDHPKYLELVKGATKDASHKTGASRSKKKAAHAVPALANGRSE